MDESALIRKAQAGDAGAFEALLSSHYDTLFRFAYRWCGSRADAEDIAQQASIKLARALGQFRFESRFNTWLYRLVINCAKDWRRSQSRHRGDDNRAGGKGFNECEVFSEGEALNQGEAFSECAGEASVYLRQVLHALEQMADGFKETALLVHAEGLTHAEAASILAIKESTVSWRLHEIRKQLHSLQATVSDSQEARL